MQVCCIECMALETKKGGPYTKQKQEKRRDEVFKLHFEYGYPAVQISKMMKINRNTINSDVAFWYSELRDEKNKEYASNWLDRQLVRLESQRVRLRKELDKENTLQERLQIERMILDLDSKTSALIIKIETSRNKIREEYVEFINNWMEEHNYNDRYLSLNSLLTIPKESREKIDKLLKK